MSTAYKPLEYCVDGLLTQGLFILAGAPKIGKSWLSLDICLSVAKGETVLGQCTAKGTALYLCLEDNKVRLQNRLYELTNEPTDSLYFSLLADTIGDGLEQQIDKIVVHHKEVAEDGRVFQQVEIYYRFIGKLDSGSKAEKTA